MKKFFLIPLMTLVCSVMAWGTTRTAGTFAQLQDAISASAAGDVIELTADITATSTINIEKSLSIDGQNHKISGAISNTGIMKIQGTNGNQVQVTLENVDIWNTTGTKQSIVLMLAGYIDSVAINHCDFKCTQNVGNPKAIEFNGVQPQAAKIGIHNSHLFANNSGYSFRSWNPVILHMSNSKLEGYGNLNFQPNVATSTNPTPYMGFSGTRGSKIYATNCDFNAPNVHSGGTNGFACFAFRDDGIDITLTNCGMNAEELGNAGQYAFDLGGWWAPVERLTESLPAGAHDINITLEGDNTHINGKMMDSQLYAGTIIEDGVYVGHLSELGARFNTSFAFVSYDENNAWQYAGTINFVIKGGTYSINPYTETFNGNIITAGLTEEQKKSDPDNLPKEQLHYTILPTDTVQVVNQGGVTLYRVVKKAQEKEPGVMYDLNDFVPVEGEGYGDNPVSSFDLSNGEDMTLNQEVTTAGYVQVKDHATEGATTVTVAQNVDPEHSQTLVINNGLDVQGASKVIVEPTAALVIGEGGITTQNSENIIIEANENGAASLLLEPTITVNQNPELTVKMTVPAEHAGYQMHDAVQYRHWFRFAVPVKDATTWTKTPNVPTYLYGWDYAGQQWAQVSVAEMDPFYGYTLSPDQEIDGSTSVTYTFKGKLLGNEDCKLELNHHGYNFFGNSYTGYISVLKLVDQIIEDSKIDGTVWMWDGEKYEGVALSYLKQYGNVPGLVENWKKEVAPMQTFVLRLTGSEFSSTDINYADAIWGNPRYTSAVASAAPARNIELNDNAVIRMTVSANNHKQSVTFIENNDFSDEYNRGYDAIKYMNENSINMYVNVNGENYGTIATDNIEGKTLSLRTTDAYTYTLTFDFAAGEEYALRDNVTGAVIAIENGVTYEFAAQPNSTIEGRFEIVAAAKMPTAIENTEVKANVKGIYTIMGQYLGEDFDILPAGVYVVDGVKIVK